ncbi:MAG: hypothetical protein ACYTG7_04540, partial [Planctomycetota bacterium]
MKALIIIMTVLIPVAVCSAQEGVSPFPTNRQAFPDPDSPDGGFFTPITLEVPGDYPTIQQAIDAAKNGFSIHVAPGTYAEHI